MRVANRFRTSLATHRRRTSPFLEYRQEHHKNIQSQQRRNDIEDDESLRIILSDADTIPYFGYDASAENMLPGKEVSGQSKRDFVEHGSQRENQILDVQESGIAIA